MHCPLLRWKKNDGSAYRLKPEETSSRELLSILKPYKNVHTFSGHSHRQCIVRMPEEEQNLADHNISGACGSWWRTRATGLKNLCPDGTPAGYELYHHRCVIRDSGKVFPEPVKLILCEILLIIAASCYPRITRIFQTIVDIVYVVKEYIMHIAYIMRIIPRTESFLIRKRCPEINPLTCRSGVGFILVCASVQYK